MERAELERLQTALDEQVKEHFPGSDMQRVVLLQYGDEPALEPGDLLVRVFMKVDPLAEDRQQDFAARSDHLNAFARAHESMFRELQREFAEALPRGTRLEFVLDDGVPNTMPRVFRRIGGSAAELAERQRGDLTPVMARLGSVDIRTLDTLITAGIATNRAEAIRWVLARIRERPAYAKLRERAQQLENLKAEF